MINVLHIARNYTTSNLYNSLFINLDDDLKTQYLYSPNDFSLNTGSPKIIVSNILKPWDKIFFRFKILKVYSHLNKTLDIKNFDLIHAHTLYSDGGVALKIKKKYKIPYIVAVRSTDINIYQKLRIDLRFYRNEILKEADKIIFLSPTSKNKFIQLLREKDKEIVNSKSTVIPNGITPGYFESNNIKKNACDDTILKLLYVGNFRNLKNISTLLSAVSSIHKTHKIKLTVAGSGGEYYDTFLKQISKNEFPFIDYKGRIEKIQDLIQLYSNSDIFIMISKPETFGQVYIEALSQGTPIIYTCNEGVDGYFDNIDIGECVEDIYSPDKVVDAIFKLSKKVGPLMSQRCVDISTQFNWVNVAGKYIKIYKSVVKIK